MSSIETVEDPEDPRLTDYREIRDAERRRRSGTFIAEGRQVVRRRFHEKCNAGWLEEKHRC